MDGSAPHGRDLGLRRPVERRLARLASEGIGHDELGRRFRRKPETIGRMLAMGRLHRPDVQGLQQGDVLRPVERRILRWRGADESYEDIGRRFRRGPGFIEQVEKLAHYRLAR